MTMVNAQDKRASRVGGKSPGLSARATGVNRVSHRPADQPGRPAGNRIYRTNREHVAPG